MHEMNIIELVIRYRPNNTLVFQIISRTSNDFVVNDSHFITSRRIFRSRINNIIIAKVLTAANNTGDQKSDSISDRPTIKVQILKVGDIKNTTTSYIFCRARGYGIWDFHNIKTDVPL